MKFSIPLEFRCEISSENMPQIKPEHFSIFVVLALCAIWCYIAPRYNESLNCVPANLENARATSCTQVAQRECFCCVFESIHFPREIWLKFWKCIFQANFSYGIALRGVSADLSDDKSTPLVQVMAWHHQAKSHFPSQWWSSYMSPNCVTGPQWVYLPLWWLHESRKSIILKTLILYIITGFQNHMLWHAVK